MARLRGHSLVGFVYGSLMLLACSAPPGAEDEGDTVPDYLGPLPGSGAPLPGNGGNPGVNTGNNGLGGNAPNSEVVGNGNVPIDGSNNGNNSGSNGSTNPPPTGGAGGSAMVPPPSGGGVGGSSMQSTGGQGGSGTTNPPPLGAGCDAGVIFCENFDGIALGAITAPVNGMRPERNVSIVEEAGRGRVLQVNAGVGYDTKAGVFIDNFVTPNNSHFGRAFIQVDAFPNAGGDHWVIVEVTQNNAGERVRPVGGQFSRWAPGSDGPSAQDWTDWDQSDAATRAGTWECVEWQVNGANGGNDLVLWVNDVEVLPIDRPQFRLPPINVLWLGWVVFQNGAPPTHQVRFDDVVISNERVGCN